MDKRIAILIAGLWLPGCDSSLDCTPAAGFDVGHFPAELSATGLASDDVQAYAPQFELWSDGATKRRWIQLPAGTTIDTRDMDAWDFPVGTKFWKEFSVDGRKIETRVLEKTGSDQGDWQAVAYIYDQDGASAVKAEYGGVNVNGSSHNVPAASECFGCHGGRPNRILGFSAVQLAFTNSDGLDLDDLVDQDLLSSPPTNSVAVPGSSTEKSALGYLHANCSHCHNEDRPSGGQGGCFNAPRSFSFLLTANAKSTGATETYATAIGEVIQAGSAQRSRVITQMMGNGHGTGMPPLGTEVVDTEGVNLLRKWINDLE